MATVGVKGLNVLPLKDEHPLCQIFDDACRSSRDAAGLVDSSLESDVVQSCLSTLPTIARGSDAAVSGSRDLQ